MMKIIRVATHSGSLGKLLEGQLKFMSAHHKIIGVGHPGDNVDGATSIEKLAQNEIIDVIPVNMLRDISPLQDLKALIKLYFIFKKEKPFVVHSHTPKAGTLSMIAAKLAKVPHRLHTVAGLPLVEASGIKRLILNNVEKLTYACCTKVYPNSKGLKDIILKHKFCKPKKLKVIGNGSSNGINTTFFNPDIFTQKQKDTLRETLRIKKDDFVFIFLGRIVKDKGINELIAAFKAISQKHHHVKLLLVGYYQKETANLLDTTNNAILNNRNIIMLEWQDDVRPYLAISNALTFPSYREGFPNTVLQASAMQLPCIVSNINGCNEIIQHDSNGVIIPVKNTLALQNSMERILLDHPYRKHLISNSRRMVCKNYEQEYIWNELLKEYNTLTTSQ